LPPNLPDDGAQEFSDDQDHPAKTFLIEDIPFQINAKRQIEMRLATGADLQRICV
jgi:hypothetical protein